MQPSFPQAPLRAAVISTFEELGFLFPTPVADLPPAAGRLATVRFHGAVTGRMELCVSDSLLPVLAANMLGISESPVQVLQDDALRELSNVVCGNVMPAVAGVEAVVHLDAPVLTPGWVTCAAAESPGASVPGTAATATATAPYVVTRNVFRFDEGCAVVTLVLAVTPP